MNDLGQDLELRLVRYFTVVAEHLNFGRAATELHLAQPSLSRQIQRLEQRLGVRLLDRTPHGNLLTEAGKAFLPEAKALLRAAHRATVTARAHAPVAGLTIGYVEDLIITPAVRELRRRHPGARIDVRFLDCRETSALTEGRVDALVARAPLPFAAGEVSIGTLYREPRVLLVPAGHALAARVSVSTADLAGYAPFPCALTDPAYRLLGTGPVPAGPAVESYQDKLELVAAGEAIAVVPEGDRRSMLRPELATVPITDAPASEVVLATRPGDPNPLIRDFRAAAREHLGRQVVGVR
ncbi:LysR family transcriptional regulator [Catenuloplanes atrovinosus]|uniref:DNA-binding transcriptional LysR family regulator n=1 Tax=Catenuloplanes atrovinosus TaxID=137266 RepID=A0AAE3YNJ5_9ACTN|nr:LysR family transcriptional regulator [Catenuloplanes atrovinosus]MDR7275334.1 DNA-binding transcriptional LysR family regulator [Catenuloplanes atrovinosus]